MTVVPERVGPPVHTIDGSEELLERIAACETTADWSFLLNDYIQWGNNTKISKHVGIFNLGATHDCVNRWTDRCQVGGDECYAVKDERTCEYVLAYARRQECLWDCLDAQTFADAFLAICGQKRVEPRALKFLQAGDIRHTADIQKMERIARHLEATGPGTEAFTYSASSHLDWSAADTLTVNRSDGAADFGDRRYIAVDAPEEIPDDALWCPFDYQRAHGVAQEDRIKCGECRLCLTDDAPDVGVTK